MAASPHRPQWRRIYRQTRTLIYKNLLIFYKAPITLVIRALVFPILITLILCYLKNISFQSQDTSKAGISKSSTPIKDLADAINSSTSHKLVIVRNGISQDVLTPVIDGILHQHGIEQVNTLVIDSPDDLFEACKQSLQGLSDCFAAVIFLAFNETDVDYIIALDDSLVKGDDVNGDDDINKSLLADRILPLQWVVDSQIGNFSVAAKPSEQRWDGVFGTTETSPDQDNPNAVVWLNFVASFVGPIFILITIGVVYHLCTFVATERQTSAAELMAAQMVTTTPRILSTILSFLIAYTPGFIACSIILTQILFTRTSDILFLLLTLLAGTSLVVSSHFIASFFDKAQLAGLYSSVLAFALALVTLAYTLTGKPAPGEVFALALIFPPATWATLIASIATREYDGYGFSLSKSPIPFGGATSAQALQGDLYVIFFIVQIVVYSVATYLVEQRLWGVKKNFDLIDASSDVAFRCTDLSKKYYGRRRWYWPFKTKGVTVVAVDKLNLEVKKGSVTFLLGPNGGGKTTILKCVAGMARMDSGSRLELNEAGLVFGICPQTNVFWENLTVQEHIKIWGKLKTAAYENLVADDDDDVLGECDLLEKANSPAKTLSGGQMRKLQLAIAFVGGSKVCCIDEASSGLDPLSRRNIWNIIQRGHTRRTILVSTHFLDEADVLADHIVIVYKGKLVCEGAGTSLKARYGDDYIIRNDRGSEGDTMVWRTPNSAEATRKVLELEALTEDETYNVVFPTLEQVFLKVTSDSNTTVREHSGDGIVGEEEPEDVINDKIFALETDNAGDIDLDVGHSIGLARQVKALFLKRYVLLRQKAHWIAYGINMIIPIIIAAALVKFFYRTQPLQTCEMTGKMLRNASAEESADFYGLLPFTVLAPLNFYNAPDVPLKGPTSFVGPTSAFSGSLQDDLYEYSIGILAQWTDGSVARNDSLAQESLDSRQIVASSAAIVQGITNSSGFFSGFGIFAPTPETATLFYDSYTYRAPVGMAGFSLITNRISNSTANNRLTSTGLARKITTSLRTMRHADTNVNVLAMPTAILIVLAFISAASVAVMYPCSERINHVRALHYCNGVSPFALWFGYLLFDTQVIIIQSVIVWGLLFAGKLSNLWYGPNYILGTFILFGVATYLGTYLVSLFVKKAAFAIAAGLHVLLFGLYLAADIMNQSFGAVANRSQTYTLLQYGLGLSSPGANLGRALFIGMNVFDVLCGKFGDNDTTNAFTYERFGGVYVNLLIQIIFLITAITAYEYGSADWLRRNITNRGVPPRLHYIVDAGDTPVPPTAEVTAEKTTSAIAAAPSPIVRVSHISKYFGRLFAVENVSFDISSNETLALLGGNGAGKTTVINMIRGELKPNFGDIYVDGISVSRQPHKARLQIGVCPQDDAVDNLTVRQTLNFYATVKGLKNIAGNVDRVLYALNISAFEDVSMKDLSGGTKRKLSVAVALLGNPRVLLLDEPSTGQDAGAKRILWKALQEVSGNRAILLTTHSMEEAEALATKVAIMGTKMLATGTLSSLQVSHGGYFTLRAVRVPETEAADVELLVKEQFAGKVSHYVDSHGQILFNLPHEKRLLGSIMKTMEKLKGNDMAENDQGTASRAAEGSSVARVARRVRVFQDYTIAGPTLEEVFMNVARGVGNAGYA